MRSITHDQYGEPAKVLRLEHVTDPRPPEGEEVLIRVVARPVNIGALLGVRGRYRASAGGPASVGAYGTDNAAVLLHNTAQCDGKILDEQ
jgi:NADPH:quinone reductase-like Zn-dependent oxidoreductase